jgi:hypothetical protein
VDLGGGTFSAPRNRFQGAILAESHEIQVPGSVWER